MPDEDKEPTPINGEDNTTEGEPLGYLNVSIGEDGGYAMTTNLDNPVAWAAVAWYIEMLARRALTMQMGIPQPEPQSKTAGLYVPEGFTADHRKGHN